MYLVQACRENMRIFPVIIILFYYTFIKIILMSITLEKNTSGVQIEAEEESVRYFSLSAIKRSKLQ